MNKLETPTERTSMVPSTQETTKLASSACNPCSEKLSQAAHQESTNATVKNIVGSLGFLDRFLTVWLVIAMIVGVCIGEFADGTQEAFNTATFHGVAAPLVVGLIVMMWPILTKVQYERWPELFRKKHIWIQIGLSFVLNWIIGPFIMLGLAWATLPDLSTYRTGVIIVGIARCIAMVNIWSALAQGDSDYCAILVIFNSILQIVLFAPYTIFFINVISDADNLALEYGNTATAVGIYLGIPLAAGIVTRFLGIWSLGRKRFDTVFMPIFGPLALLGLLFIVIVLFALQARNILDNLGPFFRVFVPLILYFVIMWTGTFFLIYYLSCRESRMIRPGGDEKVVRTWGYKMAVVQSFTSGSNNFELAIAVAIAVYGIESDQALAATVGPLIEIPVLLILTYVSLWLGKRLDWEKKWDSKASRIDRTEEVAEAERGDELPNATSIEDAQTENIVGTTEADERRRKKSGEYEKGSR